MGAMEPYTVLVVDDDELALKLAQRIFEDDADVVIEASTSAHDALSNPNAALDMIIADHRMPEMPGLIFLARMSEIVPDAMRVMLTAFPDMGLAMEGINKGLLHRLVVKPWDAEEMRHTVREDLRKHRIARRNREVSERLREWFEDLVEGERRAVAGSVGHVVNGVAAMMHGSVSDLFEQHGLLLAELNRIQRGVNAAELGRVTKAAEAMGDVASVIGKGTDELGRVVERLRQMPAIETTEERWDPNESIRVAADLLGDRFPQGAPRLTLQPVSRIDTPGSDILRILIHLLANAAEATAASALEDVTVASFEEKRSVVIEVTNPGEAKKLEELFRPFRSQRPGRLGLGLCVCRALVELSGGTIGATSGSGVTTVRVELPVRARPSSRPTST